MKVLVYSDVHANIYALKELQKTDDYKNADLRVFLGDAVMMCPYPNECLKSIWESGDVFLMGNHDSYAAYGLPEQEYPFFKADKRKHQKYMRSRIKEEYLEKLKTMPKDYKTEIAGITFYFTHYAWEDDKLVMDDPDEPDAPSQNTAKLFNNIDANYIIFGHNHKPSIFDYNNKHFICVGSLGMKYPGNYVVLQLNNKKVNVITKKLVFNVQSLKQDMLKENYPRATGYSKWFDEE